MTMGVYAIVNTVTNDLFVGSSINIEGRWSDIRKELRHTRRSGFGTQSVGRFLALAWHEYGEGAFEWRILEEVTDRAMLEARTRHYTDTLMPKYNGRVSYRRNESVSEQGRRPRMTLPPFPFPPIPPNDDSEQEQDEMDMDPWDMEGLPPALAKACADPFTYTLGLRTGEVIVFESASVSDDGQWIHLEPLHHTIIGNENWHHYPMKGPNVQGMTFNFERGIDVRLDDIVWVADAPWGS